MLKSRIQGFLWIGFVLLFFIFSDTYFSLLLLIMTVVLILFLGVSIMLIKNKVKIKLSTSGTINKGELGSLFIEAKNTSILPIAKIRATFQFQNILTGATEEQVLFFAINGKALERIPIEINSEYCGNIEISLDKVTFYDYFGIFSTSMKTTNVTSLFVLPDTFPIDINSSEFGFEEVDSALHSTMKQGLDNSELLGIKEYSPGDNVKHIHWKLTSRHDELVVKELSKTVENSTVLLLETAILNDTKLDLPEVSDAKMETFVSLSKSLLENEQIHSIGWYDHEVKELRIEEVFSMDHLTSLFKTLLKLKGIESKYSTMEHYLTQTDDSLFSHIVYITSPQSGEFKRDFTTAPVVTVLKCDVSSDHMNLANGTDVTFTPKSMEEELSQLTI